MVVSLMNMIESAAVTNPDRCDSDSCVALPPGEIETIVSILLELICTMMHAIIQRQRPRHM